MPRKLKTIPELKAGRIRITVELDERSAYCLNAIMAMIGNNRPLDCSLSNVVRESIIWFHDNGNWGRVGKDKKYL